MANHQSGEPLCLVTLERMPQQSGMLGSEDDWTGITSSTERRRLQNRLNQRAYRKKRNELGQQNGKVSDIPAQPMLSKPLSGALISNPGNLNVSRTPRRLNMTLWELFYAAVCIDNIDRQILYRIAAICKPDSITPEHIISEFERWVELCRTMGSPRTDHILVLVKFNVFRALMSNARDLGTSDREVMDDNALSPYSDPCHPPSSIRHAPTALQPTNLQRKICHHPWIDALPIPGMRDNLLLAKNSYDDQRLCVDLVGIHGESSDENGMIVWGDPWDPASWEVTESFVRYWGWTIRGCEQLYRSTNHWRERRGERPLQFERLRCKLASLSE